MIREFQRSRHLFIPPKWLSITCKKRVCPDNSFSILYQDSNLILVLLVNISSSTPSSFQIRIVVNDFHTNLLWWDVTFSFRASWGLYSKESIQSELSLNSWLFICFQCFLNTTKLHYYNLGWGSSKNLLIYQFCRVYAFRCIIYQLIANNIAPAPNLAWPPLTLPKRNPKPLSNKRLKNSLYLLKKS